VSGRETARGDEMRLKNLILILAALTTVFVLAACGPSGQPAGNQGDQGKAQEQAPQEPPSKQVAPKQAPQESGGGVPAVEPPSDETFKLTIPQMERIENDEIPTGIGTDETLFHDYAAVHLKSTGFPWEKEANVYIAGHRLGYKDTDSYLAFWDLNKLEKGDKIYVTDSEGRKYTYEVFRKFVAAPGNLSVLAPIDGKNVVTLQTCTLPDYTSRLLVRGELKDIEGS
jgi:sortase A